MRKKLKTWNDIFICKITKFISACNEQILNFLFNAARNYFELKFQVNNEKEETEKLTTWVIPSGSANSLYNFWKNNPDNSTRKYPFVIQIEKGFENDENIMARKGFCTFSYSDIWNSSSRLSIISEPKDEWKPLASELKGIFRRYKKNKITVRKLSSSIQVVKSKIFNSYSHSWELRKSLQST